MTRRIQRPPRPAIGSAVLVRPGCLRHGWLLAALLTLLLLPACSQPADVQEERSAGHGVSTRIYHGAWFEVGYPAEFTVRPSLPSSTAEGYDSAEFISPDAAVSFYVFAPQWGGEPTDIALDPQSERLGAEEMQQTSGRNLRWFTIEAADGSYRRSYLETVAQQGAVKTIVGIKYRDATARGRYQQEYQLFQQSLQLYAD